MAPRQKASNCGPVNHRCVGQKDERGGNLAERGERLSSARNGVAITMQRAKVNILGAASKGQDSHYRASNCGGVVRPIVGASGARRNPRQFGLPNNEPVSRIATRINSNPIYHGTLGLQYRHSNLVCSYGARSQLAGVKTRQLCYRNSDTRS